MQSMEKTQTSGFAKFASLVYLYTGLGITFWMLSAFALSKIKLLFSLFYNGQLGTASYPLW